MFDECSTADYFGLGPLVAGGYTPPAFLPAFAIDRSLALFVSRWSIRRKLLVCLAIVLAIVAALAYSGFSGGYSYRELAWTIRVRATDLKRAGEVQESLGDLRFSLSQISELGERGFGSQGVNGVHHAWLRSQFGQKLAKVEQDLIRYRQHLAAVSLSDRRFGDRDQERKTIDELETLLAHLKQVHGDPAVVFDLSLADRVGPEVEEMYAKARTLQDKMHDRMRGLRR